MLVKQVCALACGIKCAERVKHIHHTERQRGGDDGEYQVGVSVFGNISGKVKALGKYRKQRLFSEFLESRHGADQIDIELCIKAVNGKSEQIIKGHTADDADKHRAPHLFV